MKNINQNPRHIEAHRILSELSTAHTAAQAAETRLLGLLAAPAGNTDPLQSGLRLLRGEPAQRNDSTGLNRELAVVRERLDVLRPAVEQQRAAVAALVNELSGTVCTEALPAHTEAVQGVLDALEGLRAAQDAETALRAGIEAAGYACSLPAIAEPELNFSDTESTASRLVRDLTRRLEVQRLLTAGPTNARLLVDVDALGRAGDVVRVEGSTVARLVALGHGEPSQAKPSKAARPMAGQTEAVLS